MNMEDTSMTNSNQAQKYLKHNLINEDGKEAKPTASFNPLYQKIG